MTQSSTPKCPALDVILTNQMDVDMIVEMYPSCDSLPVNLTISGYNSITDLSGLSHLVHIDGNLTIQYSHMLTDLDGLQRFKIGVWTCNDTIK